MDKILQEIGLTKNESKIYLTLLELGPSTSGPIIKRTGIHTSKVYESLSRLERKGFVSIFKQNKSNHFVAVDPKRIEDYLVKKEQEIKKEKRELQNILPQLELLKKSSPKTSVELFEGWNGLQSAYQLMIDTMKKGEINYVVGASAGENEDQSRIFFLQHVRKLKSKGIKQKIIYNNSVKKSVEKFFEYPKSFKIKYSNITTPSEINIWQDNVMIVTLAKVPKLILISDKETASSFRQYFEMMWAIAKE